MWGGWGPGRKWGSWGPRDPPAQALDLASLVVQAVVETGERSTYGDIIIAVLPVWEEIIRYLQRDPQAVLQIDPRKWEEIIAANYERHGFDEVILTTRSGDYGRDIIAVRRGFWSVRI